MKAIEEKINAQSKVDLEARVLENALSEAMNDILRAHALTTGWMPTSIESSLVNAAVIGDVIPIYLFGGVKVTPP